MSNYVTLVFLVLSCLGLSGQKKAESLKESLNRAAIKYQISFSYDDDFISAHIPIVQTLPEEQSLFFQLLSDQYEIEAVKSLDSTYLLQPSNKSQAGFAICGSVYSQLLNEPVVGVKVMLGTQFTITNSNGSFSFYPKQKNPGELSLINTNNELKIEPILNPAECDFYFLDKEEIRLQEVLVNYTAPMVYKTNQGIYELTPNTIRTAAGLIDPDVFFLLQRLPGITSPTADASLFIRGGVPDQNLVLWNGIRLYHTSHAYGSLMSINPYGIDKVNLITKGVSSRYGEHTSGALLLSNEAKFKTPSSLSFGTNTIDSDFESDISISENSRIQISGRRSFNSRLSNNFKNISFNRLFANSFDLTPNNQVLSYQDFQFVYHQRISSKWSLKQSSLYTSDESEYQLIGTGSELREKVQSENIGFNLTGILNSETRSTTISGQFSRYDANFGRDEIEYDLSTDEDDDSDEEVDIEFSELNAKRNQLIEKQLSIVQTLKGVHSDFSFGGEWNNRQILFGNKNIVNDEFSTEQSEQANTNFISVFSEYSKHTKHYSFDFGIRSVWFEFINRIRIEPRLNGSLKLRANSLMNFSFERKSQSVYKSTETLINSLDRYTNLWVATDKDVYPLLQSNQYGIGFTSSKNRFIFDMDFYLKHIEGLTTFNFGYLDPNDQDFHIGSATVKGIDLFLQQKLNRSLFWVSYSFQDNLNTFDGLNQNQPFPSNFLIRHYLNTSGRFDLKGMSIELNSLYRSGIPYSEPNGYEVIQGIGTLTYDQLNSEKTSDFWRIDFSMQKEFRFNEKSRLSLKIAALNLLQRNNIVERFYRFNNQLQLIEKLDRYDLQPKFRVGIRLNF